MIMTEKACFKPLSQTLGKTMKALWQANG